MSKHKSADEKLHSSRPKRASLNSRRLTPTNQQQLSPAPPKGTNSNNQFR
ncbi:MAG TPA: hypothetical protein VFT49_03675 [Candidatus Saccharimonadales bacterium]|nr:hypothetical protein [Candidatus Saccharimonadales bacterium]